MGVGVELVHGFISSPFAVAGMEKAYWKGFPTRSNYPSERLALAVVSKTLSSLIIKSAVR